MQIVMIEQADTFRSVEFMGTNREKICSKFLWVNRKLSCYLNGIDVEGSLVIGKQVTNFLNRKQLASLIIGIHNRNQNGIVT